MRRARAGGVVHTCKRGCAHLQEGLCTLARGVMHTCKRGCAHLQEAACTFVGLCAGALRQRQQVARARRTSARTHECTTTRRLRRGSPVERPPLLRRRRRRAVERRAVDEVDWRGVGVLFPRAAGPWGARAAAPGRPPHGPPRPAPAPARRRRPPPRVGRVQRRRSGREGRRIGGGAAPERVHPRGHGRHRRRRAPRRRGVAGVRARRRQLQLAPPARRAPHRRYAHLRRYAPRAVSARAGRPLAGAQRRRCARHPARRAGQAGPGGAGRWFKSKEGEYGRAMGRGNSRGEGR